MRKIFLSMAVILFTALNTQAQTEKGTLLLGGTLNFQSSNGESTFMASPNLGAFISNNLALGGELNLITGGGATVWAVGPYIKPYFAVTPTGAFFAKGSFLLGGVSVKGMGSSDTQIGFGAGAGYAFFLNKSVALEFGAGYTKVGKDDDGTFGVNLGFQIHFKK